MNIINKKLIRTVFITYSYIFLGGISYATEHENGSFSVVDYDKLLEESLRLLDDAVKKTAPINVYYKDCKFPIKELPDNFLIREAIQFRFRAATKLKIIIDDPHAPLDKKNRAHELRLDALARSFFDSMGIGGGFIGPLKNLDIEGAAWQLSEEIKSINCSLDDEALKNKASEYLGYLSKYGFIFD